MKNPEKNCYPNIHFAPRYGWLNDPNGLVFHDGIYELYYQANINGVEWNDMTWGHARSKDLIHWEELSPVLFPDENGMMFSGCGLRNDRGELGLPKEALLFPYTAASFRDLHVPAKFTIRLAYSKDGGETLIKKDGVILDELAPDNRDPKVFWHEESKAYILVLWIEKNDFGIFRSENMEKFELAERYTMEDGFECPDLFKLSAYDANGKEAGKKWVFWSADGSYVVGEFDGYHFEPQQRKKKAYWQTALPYAAQTFSGDPKGRVLQTAWLRTKCVSNMTTGMMSLPRELSLLVKDGEYVLRQSLPEEILHDEGKEYSLSEGHSIDLCEDGAISIAIDSPENESIKLSGDDAPDIEVDYHSDTKALAISWEDVTEFDNMGISKPENIKIIYDRGVFEITANGDTLMQMTDIPYIRSKKYTRVALTKGNGVISVSLIK